MNNECYVHSSPPPGTCLQTVPLAGEEAAGVVSKKRHLVALPVPSRFQVYLPPTSITLLLFYCFFADDTGIYFISQLYGKLHAALKQWEVF